MTDRLTDRPPLPVPLFVLVGLLLAVEEASSLVTILTIDSRDPLLSDDGFHKGVVSDDIVTTVM